MVQNSVPLLPEILDASTSVQSVTQESEAQPGLRILYQPNPVRENATISFHQQVAGPVRLSVYNMIGQRVRVLLEEPMEVGTHSVFWDGRDENHRGIPSGIYFLKLNTPSGAQTTKVTLLK